MKYFYLLTMFLIAQPFFGQDNQITTNWEEAKKMAEANDKDILVIMTGNEWCVTSRDMRKRVLEHKDFTAYANSNTVTYIIDIPNEFCEGDGEELEKYHNLSAKYNTDAFPAMLLVDSDGEKIKEIEGKLYKRKNVLEQLSTTSRSL